MTDNFVKRNSRDFFEGKKAKVTARQTNLGGDTIEKDTIVTILGKNQKHKTSLDIKSDDGVTICMVSCDYLELIK